MLVVRNKKALINRFPVLLGNNTELQLYRTLKDAAHVTAASFSGNRRLFNVYVSIVKSMIKAKKLKSKDDYALFLMTFKPKALDKVEEASAAFMESVAVHSLAMHKTAVEEGFERIYGQRATVVTPDRLWQQTAQDAQEAIKRFDKAVGQVIDRSLTDDGIAAIVDDGGKSMSRRMADEAFLSQSRIGQRVAGAIGSDKYIWHNMGDIRVVGRPDGLYPVGTAAHGDHWTREGKVFLWSEPPEDGLPGQAYGCRCVALPVLGLNSPEIA